jgi:SAM-dependent methyltransferase
MANVVDSINLRTMDSAAAVAAYSGSQSLTRAEQASLDRVRQEARDKPILDLGVGAGRTINALREVSRDYLAIDNSEAMLAAARRRYPDVRLEHADARDLGLLRDGTIFLAMFSCNGIGMVGHEDRLRIMRAVFRVLQPGGVFLFSTHNQDCPDHTAGFRFPEFEPSANPARLLVRAMRFARDTVVSIANRRRFRRHDVRTPEYSVINDYCHNYGTMLYYITLENQRRQLEHVGFAPNAEAYDREGNLITGGSRESSIAFVARKPG